MMVSAEPSATPRVPANPDGYGFGTFKGGLIPSILTFRGVIMLMRFPCVLGSVGLLGTSRQADLLFLGMRSIGESETLDDYASCYASLSTQTDGLPPTGPPNAGEEMDLHRLFAGV